ncbi:MAG TPA: HyaD/HybD family hydrogenase maturation endopeptidase [Candidatus Binataceae bacterium]|nr:HyaD/HybD family hydrogenase maturation endopeptidase [Candidatus Binataceae bacterium]
MPEELLVLGLGNVLLRDDGLGVVAVAQLERDYEIPPQVRVADGGTLGMTLLGLFTESEHVILVDAVRVDAPPGTLVRIDGDDVPPAVRTRLSPHQIGVADLLDSARLMDSYPTSVTLLGLVPDNMDLSVERSAPVEAGLNGLVEAIVREARGLGYELSPKRIAKGRGRDRGAVRDRRMPQER